MKEIQLRKTNIITLVDDDDFEKLSNMKWYPVRGGYAKALIANKKQEYMHRYILQITDSNLEVDHIDGNRLNNQKSNLRICTVGENHRNVSKHKNSTSKFKGVCWVPQRKKWEVNLNLNKKRVYRAFFENEIDAAKAYNDAAKQYHGKFAKLNKLEKE